MKQTVCQDIPEQNMLIDQSIKKLTSFWIDVIQMVHDELRAGCEVRSVELIRDVPAERPKLAALLQHGVQEGDRIEHGGPGKVVGVVQGVLGDVRVRPLQARSDPLRWFVCVLQSHLEQPNWESRVDLCCHPQPEETYSQSPQNVPKMGKMLCVMT